jgi:hypothetical protein
MQPIFNAWMAASIAGRRKPASWGRRWVSPSGYRSLDTGYDFLE